MSDIVNGKVVSDSGLQNLSRRGEPRVVPKVQKASHLERGSGPSKNDRGSITANRGLTPPGSGKKSKAGACSPSYSESKETHYNLGGYVRVGNIVRLTPEGARMIEEHLAKMRNGHTKEAREREERLSREEWLAEEAPVLDDYEEYFEEAETAVEIAQLEIRREEKFLPVEVTTPTAVVIERNGVEEVFRADANSFVREIVPLKHGNIEQERLVAEAITVENDRAREIQLESCGIPESIDVVTMEVPYVKIACAEVNSGFDLSKEGVSVSYGRNLEVVGDAPKVADFLPRTHYGTWDPAPADSVCHLVGLESPVCGRLVKVSRRLEEEKKSVVKFVQQGWNKLGSFIIPDCKLRKVSQARFNEAQAGLRLAQEIQMEMAYGIYEHRYGWDPPRLAETPVRRYVRAVMKKRCLILQKEQRKQALESGYLLQDRRPCGCRALWSLDETCMGVTNDYSFDVLDFEGSRYGKIALVSQIDSYFSGFARAAVLRKRWSDDSPESFLEKLTQTGLVTTFQVYTPDTERGNWMIEMGVSYETMGGDHVKFEIVTAAKARETAYSHATCGVLSVILGANDPKGYLIKARYEARMGIDVEKNEAFIAENQRRKEYGRRQFCNHHRGTYDGGIRPMKMTSEDLQEKGRKDSGKDPGRCSASLSTLLLLAGVPGCTGNSTSLFPDMTRDEWFQISTVSFLGIIIILIISIWIGIACRGRCCTCCPRCDLGGGQAALRRERRAAAEGEG